MRTTAVRRRCRGAVALSLAAAACAAGLAFSQPEPGSAAKEQTLNRRAVLAAPAAALGLSSASRQAWAAISKDGKKEVQLALDALHNLQQTWGDLEKQGDAAVGEAVAAVLGSTLEKVITINVNAGDSLGVDVDGLAVVDINNKGLGWAKGDYIEQIDGTFVENKDNALDVVKAVKAKNQPYQVIARRRFTSAFVGLERPLRKVYEDCPNPVPEVEEVMTKYSKLRTKAGLVADGVVPASELKTKLDGFTADIDAYMAGPAAPAPAAKSSGGGSDDLSGLFS